MPEENIVDIAEKCQVLLLDIEGTTTSISFVKDSLFPYAAQHVRGFLQAGWDDSAVQHAVEALRKLALDDARAELPGAVAVPDQNAPQSEQIDGVVSSVEWLMSQDRKAGPLKELQGLIWKQGYDKGELRGHVYEDVPEALSAWRARESRRVYIYSSGSEAAQRLLFAHSQAGDLLPHIDGHFDTSVGPKQEPDSYKAIAEKTHCPSDKILFLTDVLQEAEAARAAGLQAALVVREGNAPLPTDVPFPVISSLAVLSRPAETAGKRKQDMQEEQPAKVAKVNLEDDVKSSAENLATAQVLTAEDSMDVDSTTTPADIQNETPDKEEIEKKEEIEIEEIQAEAAAEAEELLVEPIAVELPEHRIGTEIEEKIETETEKLDKVEQKLVETESPVAEESPSTVTEIEEITEQKLEDVVENVDMEPIIEEPLDTALDAELQNVGDVLEKECDELLSKVKDVTDLAQPLLETIGEEGEADNLDNIPSEVIEEIDNATKAEENPESEQLSTIQNEEQTERLTKTSDDDKVHLNGNAKESNGTAHNGSSNGNSVTEHNGEGEKKINGNGLVGAEEADTGSVEAEIKVKTVPTPETVSDAVEQPTDV